MDTEANGYRLTVGGYTGTAGDEMVVGGSVYHDLNGMKFTTVYNDNDIAPNINCAVTPVVGLYCGGGFWYRACGRALINTPLGCVSSFRWGRLQPIYSRLVVL